MRERIRGELAYAAHVDVGECVDTVGVHKTNSPTKLMGVWIAPRRVVLVAGGQRGLSAMSVSKSVNDMAMMGGKSGQNSGDHVVNTNFKGESSCGRDHSHRSSSTTAYSRRIDVSLRRDDIHKLKVSGRNLSCEVTSK